MANTTISLIKAPLGSNYTVARLNTIFSTIAAVLNGKLDSRDPDVVNLSVNGNRVINMADGVNGSDAITYRQMLSMVAGAEGLKAADYSASYEPYTPTVVTEANFAEAVRANILAIQSQLPFKFYNGPNPMRRALNAGGSQVRLVADPINPNDAVNLKTLAEYARAQENI